MIESEDLLAYEGINQDVPRLYAAFLDMTLLELARENPADYWREVERFRQRKLDPVPVRGFDEGSSEALEALKATAEHEPYRTGRAFLYWFDLRAQYWHSRIGKLPRGLASARLIEEIYETARTLQERVEGIRGETERPGAADFDASALAVEEASTPAVDEDDDAFAGAGTTAHEGKARRKRQASE